MLYIDESQLSRYIFTDVSFGDGSNFLLIDAAGNVVSSQNAELLGEDLADDPIFQQITALRQAGENNFLFKLNGVDTVSYTHLPSAPAGTRCRRSRGWHPRPSV